VIRLPRRGPRPVSLAKRPPVAVRRHPTRGPLRRAAGTVADFLGTIAEALDDIDLDGDGW
jgi:hypothetical protein